MKNVTITLEEDVALWARVRAAKQDMSLSRMLGQLLKAEMRREARAGSEHSPEYRAAMERFFSIAPGESSGPPLKRDELHDRPGLRRHQRAGLREDPSGSD